MMHKKRRGYCLIYTKKTPFWGTHLCEFLHVDDSIFGEYTSLKACFLFLNILVLKSNLL